MASKSKARALGRGGLNASFTVYPNLSPNTDIITFLTRILQQQRQTCPLNHVNPLLPIYYSHMKFCTGSADRVSQTPLGQNQHCPDILSFLSHVVIHNLDCVLGEMPCDSLLSMSLVYQSRAVSPVDSYSISCRLLQYLLQTPTDISCRLLQYVLQTPTDISMLQDNIVQRLGRFLCYIVFSSIALAVSCSSFCCSVLLQCLTAVSFCNCLLQYCNLTPSINIHFVFLPKTQFCVFLAQKHSQFV